MENTKETGCIIIESDKPITALDLLNYLKQYEESALGKAVLTNLLDDEDVTYIVIDPVLNYMGMA